MPHKRNPILCENLCGLARLVRSHAAAACENVALWHERDISHSSVERVIAPDATILVDFMLARFAGVVEKMVVSPVRMLVNIEATGGLIYSSAVLTTLIERGIARDAAYAIVQQCALAAFSDPKQSFRERLIKDQSVTQVITAAEISAMFEPLKLLGHVDEIFARAGL